jgi:hypothetical protein
MVITVEEVSHLLFQVDVNRLVPTDKVNYDVHVIIVWKVESVVSPFSSLTVTSLPRFNSFCLHYTVISPYSTSLDHYSVAGPESSFSQYGVLTHPYRPAGLQEDIWWEEQG